MVEVNASNLAQMNKFNYLIELVENQKKTSWDFYFLHMVMKFDVLNVEYQLIVLLKNVLIVLMVLIVLIFIAFLS